LKNPTKSWFRSRTLRRSTHKVTAMDNLAGIAIRYGVTIRDIKRANGGMINDATLFARGSGWLALFTTFLFAVKQGWHFSQRY
jgi:hypothetical protein